MRLYLTHPGFVERTCQSCQAFIYEDKPGSLGMTPLRMVPGGPPLARPAGVATPCHECPKIPAGVAPRPENGIELNERNIRAYRHYLECRATLSFPDDPIVRRNARIIRSQEDEVASTALLRQTESIVQLLVRGYGRA